MSSAGLVYELGDTDDVEGVISLLLTPDEIRRAAKGLLGLDDITMTPEHIHWKWLVSEVSSAIWSHVADLVPEEEDK